MPLFRRLILTLDSLFAALLNSSSKNLRNLQETSSQAPLGAIPQQNTVSAPSSNPKWRRGQMSALSHLLTSTPRPKYTHKKWVFHHMASLNLTMSLLKILNTGTE